MRENVVRQTVLLSFVAAMLVLGVVGAASAVATLRIDTPFVVRGSAALFTVTGSPGANVSLFVSRQPAEVPAGALGTLFRKPGTIIPIGNAVLDGNGTATIPLTIPAISPVATVLYVQALEISAGPMIGLSNAVPLRVVDAAPSGRRATLAGALTDEERRQLVEYLKSL